MSIGDVIAEVRNEKGMTQKELADVLHFDRSFIAKVESGDRNWPEAHDAKLAGVSWKAALTIADERSGGYISNILLDNPDIDLHPAALKDVLLRQMREGMVALEELQMARHIDPARRRESAEKTYSEMLDIEEFCSVMRGVLEEEFGLDRKQLMDKHALEVKRGER